MASRCPQRFFPGGFQQALDLGLGQMLAGPQLGIGAPPRGNCSFYGGWRDQLEVRFRHCFRPSRFLTDPNNAPSSNS